MERGLTGHYEGSIAGGVRCQAFIPDPLPPRPPLVLDGKLQGRINQAMLALGRLKAVTAS
ncbi:hypothetical protein [Halomonas lysinitropha]|uniref:Uncharacterized protein n=1 Tax=Halomonas lysinitropha TaxID=2607506 RepID=A0A5K1I3P6_9GAMM|nr:hypothetical protein [Halomonas lysinitropha]VVZ96214.1 hypothetical protein HALO32_02310 [Halomonas lysinitropha]